jgi:DnaK suppressor protein
MNANEKNRYSDYELQEFKQLIIEKLGKAQKDYEMYKSSITQSDGNDTQDTSPTFKVLEEGAATLSKEEAGKLAQRQQQFIQYLQAALVRIENKTYGICSKCKKIISKSRLYVAPHASMCILCKEPKSVVSSKTIYLFVRED